MQKIKPVLVKCGGIYTVAYFEDEEQYLSHEKLIAFDKNKCEVIGEVADCLGALL